MIQETVTITKVESDELNFCNSRTLRISVISNSGEKFSVTMSCTPATPYSQRSNFDWLWENASPGMSCILIRDESFFENSLLPPKK